MLYCAHGLTTGVLKISWNVSYLQLVGSLCISEMPKKGAKKRVICALCYHFFPAFNMSCRTKKMARQMVKSCNWIPVVLVIVLNNWCFCDCSPYENQTQCKSQTSAINYILIKSHEVEVIYCCPCRKSQCLFCAIRPSIIFLKLERQRQIIQLQTSPY